MRGKAASSRPALLDASRPHPAAPMMIPHRRIIIDNTVASSTSSSSGTINPIDPSIRRRGWGACEGPERARGAVGAVHGGPPSAAGTRRSGGRHHRAARRGFQKPPRPPRATSERAVDPSTHLPG
eukprot:scaffold1136_cov399-Prasinococcus_capsulatus_cf.AAC.6